MHYKLAETIQYFAQGIKSSHRPEDRTLASDYLAALAPLLAKAVLGQDILREISSIDRLFGQSWIAEIKPFEKAFASWEEFKREYENWSLSSMTVNERLFALDLLNDFEEACKAKDTNKARALLERVLVDKDSIDAIIRKHNNND